MDPAEEMKKWVTSLSTSEKRFIKMLVKARSGNTDSQQLEYFDWLNQAAANDPIPANARFALNLPTITNRLKDLILDGLRLLNKDSNIDALLRTTLDEIVILRQKKLSFALARQLKRTKKVALEHGRYGFVLQCIKIEQELALAAAGNSVVQALQVLRAEELHILAKLSEWMELQYRHSLLQARTAHIMMPRTATEFQDLQEFAADDLIVRLSEEGNYLEQALATNILAIKYLIAGTPQLALPKYMQLLQDWNDHPEWQLDQGPLLYFVCNCYQSLCFHSPLSVEEFKRYMSLIPDFKGLPIDVARDFQRMLYHNQFTFVFNMGNLERLPSLIVEIDQWLDQHQADLSEARVLPFLHNFLMAEFITGRHAEAKRRVQRILNMPNRKVREDIREFAQVIYAILQYESGDAGLNEYLLRAGKRHFKKYVREVEFELAIFGYLEKTLLLSDKIALETALNALIQQLDELAEQLPGTLPLIGLTEMRLWAKSKKAMRPLQDVFLEAVQENLASLG